MLIATLRGMLAHQLRLVLTTASIALGVAFLAGTLMLTDTMRLAFDQLFGQVSSGTDAVVRQEAAYDATAGVGLNRQPIAASVLDQVAAVDGVAAAEGFVSGYALLTDDVGEGRAHGGRRSHHGLQHAVGRGPARRGAPAFRDGPGRRRSRWRSTRPPPRSTPSTSAPPSRSCSGDRPGSSRSSGSVGYGDEGDLGGTTSAYFDTATAQSVLGTPGQFDEVAGPGGRRRE